VVAVWQFGLEMLGFQVTLQVLLAKRGRGMGCQDLAEKEMDIKAGNDKITKIRLTST
jgi:hypothetical protein